LRRVAYPGARLDATQRSVHLTIRKSAIPSLPSPSLWKVRIRDAMSSLLSASSLAAESRLGAARLAERLPAGPGTDCCLGEPAA
jgi:hypothetical protein